MSRPIGVIAGLSPIKLSTRMVANPLAGDSASPPPPPFLRARMGVAARVAGATSAVFMAIPVAQHWWGASNLGDPSAGGIVGAAASTAPIPDI